MRSQRGKRTENESIQRGYDDTALLKKMADGLVIREFNSVDEAAKSVLGEAGGSNVDRLRRKFREQNWYEKGLADYVEAEIRSRRLLAPTPSVLAFAKAQWYMTNPLALLAELYMFLMHLNVLSHVLTHRKTDLDGRRITFKEKFGGFLRCFFGLIAASSPLGVADAIWRHNIHALGGTMIVLSLSCIGIGYGMKWNPTSIQGDLTRYLGADKRSQKLLEDKQKSKHYVMMFRERMSNAITSHLNDSETMHKPTLLPPVHAELTVI